MLKVVIDTNVFVSGVLTKGGISSIVIKAWKRTKKFQLFVTEEIIQEVLRVMRKLKINQDIIIDWDSSIRKNAIKVVPGKRIDVVKEDSADNKFLECAIEIQADYIVTGDKHLKRLNEFGGVKIVNVKRFLEFLKNYKEEGKHHRHK